MDLLFSENAQLHFTTCEIIKLRKSQSQGSVERSLTSEGGRKLRRKRFKSDVGTLIERPVRRGGQFAAGKSGAVTI